MKKGINIGIIVGIIGFIFVVGVSAATLIVASNIKYNDTTVQEKVDELIELSKNSECIDGTLCSKVSVGDYISMTPTQTTYTILATDTGYDSNQTIKPSELKLWRVIDIRNDGTIEIVSEHISSASVYFNGKTGFVNFVGTLNTIASQYGNSSYTINSRHMGYNGQTSTITDVSKITNPAPWTLRTSDNSNEKVGGGDMMYLYDASIYTGTVYKALGTLAATKPDGSTIYYWLASRDYIYHNPTDYGFIGRIVTGDGNVISIHLYHYYNTGWVSNKLGYAIRPILTLKPDITNFTGSGTSSDPWVLP